MKAFDITIQCERGKYKLMEARVIPTKEKVEALQETLTLLDLGKIEKIIIDNFK